MRPRPQPGVHPRGSDMATEPIIYLREVLANPREERTKAFLSKVL